MLTLRHNLSGKRPGVHQQRGVGLVEILIAVLVLSIGLLGMAGLQTVSLRNNQSSYQRGMAVVHAYYIADAMHMDKINARAGAFNLALSAATPTATNFATQSLNDWRAGLQSAMGANATGSVDCGGPSRPSVDICDIVVSWDDSRGGAQGAGAGSNSQEVRVMVEL